jgi:microcystin-dependent protein
MPSTYSPDLRIELIANGEQSGTWGVTTNSNLGTIIEDAISGLATVTISSSNQALTALNGAADQARCAALSLTGGSAPFNLFVPPVTKLYVIKNNTAYSASVYCSTVLGNTTAAGSGVDVHAGKSALVRSDGTNIVDQINYVSDSFEIGATLTVNGAATFGSTVTLDANPTLALQAATKQYVDSAAAGSSPSGALIMWPTGTAPTGWLLCDGAAVSRSTYAALFAVIGTTFGVGDNSTTFNLPDYRDRMPIGANTIAASIGATGGSKDATLVSHTHTASVSDPGHTHTTTLNVRRGANALYTNAGWGGGDRTDATNVIGTSNSRVTGITVSNSTEGSSGTNANMPPYLGINFIIKT